jgi:Protein of unknown function (DUF4239)
MLSATGNVIVLVLVVAAALFFMVVVNRLWPLKARYGRDDLIGWQLETLATIQAVVMGFMLYTGWTNLQAIKLNIEVEASALQNLYRLSDGLPSEVRTRIQAQSLDYAQAAVEGDWPDLATGRLPEKTHLVNQSMWRTLTRAKVNSPSEAAALDQTLSELRNLTQCRRTRLLQSNSHLPGIFWCLLIVGSVLTIISVAMFGSSIYSLHVFQVFSLTVLITLAMLTIADLDRPFVGVHVASYPFQRALHNMHELE